jgi:hypothetical protein
MLGEILTGINILEKLGKCWNWLRVRVSRPNESLAARFIRLFESHDVHRNQIPRFFGHGLTLKDVQDDTSLFAKLDEAVLTAACALFAVRREWLDGAEPQVYPRHDFYKHPEDVAGFLGTLKANNPDGNLDGVLIAPNELDGDALLLLQETIGGVGDKPIYRIHLCNNWTFRYWKSRAYLTACVAIAWKHGVYVRGVYLPKKDIERMASGEMLVHLREDGDWACGGKKWYPEDMALRPGTYLLGVDPEQNHFGIEAALGLWLDLEQEGYMRTGLPMYEAEAIRELFQQQLAKYLPATDITTN